MPGDRPDERPHQPPRSSPDAGRIAQPKRTFAEEYFERIAASLERIEAHMGNIASAFQVTAPPPPAPPGGVTEAGD